MAHEPINIKDSRILVVDDTPANLDLFSQILESEGYAVSFATNGKQALKLASLDKPDLILLDIMMPEMDGIETCRRLKSLKDVKEIPVIFITAKTDRKDVVEGFKAGGVDYISKPVQHEEVCARVRSHLRLQALVKIRDDLITMLCQHNKRIEALVSEQNKQLLQNEKLAAIGDMVGEFTHEINSPVGIAITALSYMLEEIETVKNHYDDNKLDREEFSRFLQSSMESTTIANNNLKRLVNLIQSFKRITVDQCSDQPARFDLKTCLADVITSLQPRLKHTPHQLHWECDDNLFIYSYPGVFAQMLINLVNNSLLHAFDEASVGEIKLVAGIDGDNLKLCLSDNGKGIPEAQQQHIFDKFYTTKRGKEGTGLGLYIVHELAQEKLGGSIACHSEPGNGCKFVITIPLSGLMEATV